MIDISGARFWQSYDVIDIWVVQDMKGGTSKYFFWFGDKLHEGDEEREILNLAKRLLNESRGR